MTYLNTAALQWSSCTLFIVVLMDHVTLLFGPHVQLYKLKVLAEWWKIKKMSKYHVKYFSFVVRDGKSCFVFVVQRVEGVSVNSTDYC